MNEPVNVVVTGAAGNIAYSAIFRVAAGQMLGENQPINLMLIDIEPAMNALNGVKFELEDCAFPLLNSITTTFNLNQGFEQCDYALLIGAKPRMKGMERKDLLKDNGKIFKPQGKAINEVASKKIKVLVVGNPANTNALITMHNAPTIDPKQFTSMMRLDHDRSLAQVANKYNTNIKEVKKIIVWGNHSNTQVPDLSNAEVSGKNIKDIMNEDWYKNDFIPRIQNRGAEIIEARGSSSAASAANAAITHMRDWVSGNNDWLSIGQISNSNPFNISEDIMFSFPSICNEGSYEMIKNIEMSEILNDYIKITEKELIQERDSVLDLL
ncbi:MAG: malate dehydrogenase [Gammaproteobacteria bacterium]|jgi:malate dehydrogenase|nr:malate dehydrogenase [Gammaproteobacteria bacterium]MBT6754849.1 malate dehydrogenase [Gammaproteobacteria bacterium]MBT7523373.1 malate dehydrogenase [Gammaproteobacteria bacterium]MBT7814287.1 malate dehydrogenase [Gammaproteobacteria bacterium]MDC3386044.1 malate dehydrogenase [Gammaproteobacteria bacterium]